MFQKWWPMPPHKSHRAFRVKRLLNGPRSHRCTIRAGLGALLVVSALHLGAAHSDALPSSSLQSLRQTLSPFAPHHPTQLESVVHKYQQIYHLSSYWKHYSIGTIAVEKCTVVVQYFLPSNARATALTVHGYYDHSGLMAPLINELLNEHIAVVAVDLPGHGLSGGPRAAIDDFGEYAEAVQATITALKPVQIGPLFAIGHSTGCAALLEYVVTTADNGVDGAVFVAPLVRSAFWTLSKIAQPLVSWKSESPRWYRNSSSDKGFLTFLKNDPLGYDRFPSRWSSALFTWEQRTQRYGTCALPLLIVQGDKDETVDWRYNLPFLHKLFPNSQTIIIPGGRHHLLNESPPLRRKAFEAITRWLIG
jgi:alpha-beta hydrolase superfamily lysophospholipase